MDELIKELRIYANDETDEGVEQRRAEGGMSMGVYIKGMEMPTSCRACLYSRTDIRNVDWCVLTEKDLPCDCPLVPVPPHGRLGDLDKLADNMCSATAGMEHRAIIMHEIRRAPTVIEAEEET